MNDVILTSDSEKKYEVPKEERKPGYFPPRKFKDITKEQYWNL